MDHKNKGANGSMSKLDDDLKALTQSSEIDQALTGISNVALVMVSYLKTLIAAGMKPDQAFRLTRDYHRIQMTKALYPDTPPAFGGED